MTWNLSKRTFQTCKVRLCVPFKAKAWWISALSASIATSAGLKIERSDTKVWSSLIAKRLISRFRSKLLKSHSVKEIESMIALK